MRHRPDYRFDPDERGVVDVRPRRKPVHTREHAQHLAERSHLLDLLKLLEEIFERELRFAQFRFELDRLFLVELLLRLLDQCDNVPHPEYAGGEPVGMEFFQRIKLLTGGDELDRLPDRGAQRNRRASARVTVHFRQDRAVEIEPFVERAGGVDRVLSGHRIDDEEDLVGRDGRLDRLDLLHHLFVDMQASGGVDDDHVPCVLARMLDCPPGDRHGGSSRGLVHGKPDLCPERHELIHRGRAVDVRRRQERIPPLLLQVPRQLCTECRLA